MEIIIPLPSSSSINTYGELNAYLKQLELAVHYAQKSVKNAEDMGLKISEDTFTCFNFPSLAAEIEDNNYSELQSIELKINLQ